MTFEEQQRLGIAPVQTPDLEGLLASTLFNEAVAPRVNHLLALAEGPTPNELIESRSNINVFDDTPDDSLFSLDDLSDSLSRQNQQRQANTAPASPATSSGGDFLGSINSPSSRSAGSPSRSSGGVSLPSSGEPVVGAPSSSKISLPTSNPFASSATPKVKIPQKPEDFTYESEARTDSSGRLQVYRPPKGDGGGSFEVAGITATFQPKEAARLRKLIENGQAKQAESEAREFYRKRAAPFVAETNNPGLKLQLADSVHHRGEGGLLNMLQRSTGSNSENHAQHIQALDSDPAALDKFDLARREYEAEVKDKGLADRKKFRKGLTNRFDKANAAATALEANATLGPPEPVPSPIEVGSQTILGSSSAATADLFPAP